MINRTRTHRLLHCIAAASLIQPSLGRAQADAEFAANEAIRAEFLAAYELAESGAPPPGADSDALRAYPLYPYIQASRIKQQLTRATEGSSEADQYARDFLEFYDVEPVGRSVRRAWLTSLARRAVWPEFLRQYQKSAADTILGCQYLMARIEVGETDGLAPLVSDRWLTANQLPIECEPVFEWLRGRGVLDDELTKQRARLLLDDGNAAFARIILRRVSENESRALIAWAEAIEHPERFIAAVIAAPSRAVERDALQAAWRRLARRDPAMALERFDALMAAHDLDESLANELALALALGLAWDRRPQALELFALVDDAHFDDESRGWQARAAMWADDWAGVANSIATMSEQAQDEFGWRYWAARAAEKNGATATAGSLYEAVLPGDNFYAALAAARLGRRFTPTLEPLARNENQTAELAALPPFVRARELLWAGLRASALREWRHGSAILADELRPQTIHLAARWGWYDVAVATATEHRVFNDYVLLYPQPYAEIITAAADSAELDPALIFGLVRQESLFTADAVSSANAIGLAQLQIETARRAARRWDLAQPSRNDLLDPAVNVPLGAGQLRALADEFDGRIMVALAGYNAGYNAARRWLPQEQPLASDVWIENIPFNETRAYVRRVLWHSLVYRWLATGRAQAASAWLTEIDERPAGD